MSDCRPKEGYSRLNDFLPSRTLELIAYETLRLRTLQLHLSKEITIL